jgi:hypothetical protein
MRPSLSYICLAGIGSRVERPKSAPFVLIRRPGIGCNNANLAHHPLPPEAPLRGVPFRALTDMDVGYALNLGLIFWVGQKIMEMYSGFGIDLAHFQGNGGWFVPIPATLVVGSDGRIKTRFVDPDFRHRIRTEDVLKAVREAAKS